MYLLDPPETRSKQASMKEPRESLKLFWRGKQRLKGQKQENKTHLPPRSNGRYVGKNSGASSTPAESSPPMTHSTGSSKALVSGCHPNQPSGVQQESSMYHTPGKAPTANNTAMYSLGYPVLPPSRACHPKSPPYTSFSFTLSTQSFTTKSDQYRPLHMPTTHAPLLPPQHHPGPSYHHLPPGPLQQLCTCSTCICLFLVHSPPKARSARDYWWEEGNNLMKPARRRCTAWSPPPGPPCSPTNLLLSLHVGHIGLPSASRACQAPSYLKTKFLLLGMRLLSLLAL